MLRYAWREALRRKSRSVAAIFSYSLAVLVFTLLISLLHDSDYSMSKTLQNTGTHFIAFIPVCCNLPQLKDGTNEGFWANGTSSAVMSTNILNEIKKIPSVKDVSPMLMYLFYNPVQKINFTVAGFIPENIISVSNTTCASTDIIEGEFLKSTDNNSIMVEHSYAISHKLAVSDSFVIEGKTFWIKGIINAGIRPVKADVYMPFAQAEKIISRRTWSPLQDQMNVILVESANAQVHKQAILNVKKLLGKDNIVSSYSCHVPAASVINLNRGTLLFTCILMMMFMLMHVFRNQYASYVERKHDIGILHSIGWSRLKIILFLVNEFAFQAFVGGLLGCLLAILYKITFPSVLVPGYFYLVLDSIWISSIGFGLAFFASVVSAFIIARYAANIQPMKNLRNF